MAQRPELLQENETTKYKKWRGNSWVEFIYKLEKIGAEFSMKAVIPAYRSTAKDSVIQNRAKEQRILG